MAESPSASVTDNYRDGSISAFRASWQGRPETKRYHFHRGTPQNQIQFAFQNHWRVFEHMIGDIKSGRAIEVGCGRGSMAAFFADNGFEVHLLDTSSAALYSARENFSLDGLRGYPIVGDTLTLPYRDNSFDVLVSIGLLEHFEDVRRPIIEQLRILRPGGLFLGYVVPERTLSVQTLVIPVNLLLSIINRLWKFTTQPRSSISHNVAKAPLYRNQYKASYYLDIFQRAGVHETGSFGMFPVPLVSHSPHFPFSLMHPVAESCLVWLWQHLLALRVASPSSWICSEAWGLAFLVWARK